MHIKYTFSLVALVCLLLFGASCSFGEKKIPTSSQDQIKVLCTTGMIRDLVKEIGQQEVEVLTLIKEDLDPHTYELVKGDDEKLSTADLVFYNGLGLEHSPNIYRHLSEHPHSFAVGNRIKEEHPDRILYVNGQLDPHIWMDISLWEEGVDFIVSALSERLPQKAEFFSEQGAHLHEEMKRTHQQILDLLQSIPEHQRYLVTCHDAFNYFTRCYLSTECESQNERWRERCIAPEGLSPDSQLSMTDIKEVVDYLKKHDVQVIFPESNVNLDSIHKIKEVSKKMGLTLFLAPSALYADSLGKPGDGQDTYLKMLYYNAEIIAKCLKSKEAYER